MINSLKKRYVLKGQILHFLMRFETVFMPPRPDDKE